MRTILYTLLLCLSGGYASAQCTPVITPQGYPAICSGIPMSLWAGIGDTYQWYHNGNIIPGANDDFYDASIPGDYTVERDLSGCVATSAVFTVVEDTFLGQPGVITASNDVFCMGTTQTFSVDPVPGATFYNWHENTLSGWSGEFQDDSSNVATVVAGSSQGSQGQLIVSVFAYNICGPSAPSTKTVYVHAPPQIGGFDSNPDILPNTTGAYCPAYGPITLHPTTHGNPGGYTAPMTFQWYRGSVAIAGQTGQYMTTNHGGNLSVKIITEHCGTFTVPKVLHQRVPTSATITPNGPLSFCQNNVQPLQVTFDMTGVDGPISWGWSQTGFGNAYSIIPDTSGYYNVGAYNFNSLTGECRMTYPGPLVTMPQPLIVTQTDDTLFATPGYDTYQWFESGALLPGETNQKLILTVDGFYSVEGVFSNGCVESSVSFDSDFMPPPPPEPPMPPGATTPEPGEQLTVSPNPVTGSFVLSAKIAPGDTKATIMITDATGRMLFEKEVDVVDGIVKEKIDLGNTPSSIGSIRLRSASTLKTTRFFKK